MSEERTYKLFLVDDDTKHLLLLKEHLIKHLPYNLDIVTYSSGTESLNNLDKNPDLIVLDYYFDGEGEEVADGVEILKTIRDRRPDVPVVMMSHQDKIEIAVTCYDYGAKDYVIKNETAFARAQLVVRNIIHQINRETAIEKFRKNTFTAYRIIGAFFALLIGIIVYLIVTG